MEKLSSKNILGHKLNTHNRLDVSDLEQVGAVVVLGQEAWKNANSLELAGWALGQIPENLELNSGEIGELFVKKMIEAWQKRARLGGKPMPTMPERLARTYEERIMILEMFLDTIEYRIERIKSANNEAEIVQQLESILGVFDAQEYPSPFILSSHERQELSAGIENIINANLSTLDSKNTVRAAEVIKTQTSSIISQLRSLLVKFTNLKNYESEAQS